MAPRLRREVSVYHLGDGHGSGGHGVGGVSPVGAGAHGLGLPAASSRWLLLYQLAPLELWPDTHTHTHSVPRGKDYAKDRNKMNHNRLCGGETCLLPSVKRMMVIKNKADSLFCWRRPKLQI